LPVFQLFEEAEKDKFLDFFFYLIFTDFSVVKTMFGNTDSGSII